MPLFFFHFFDGETRNLDESGLELESAEAAYLEAAAAARAMWAELLAERRDPLRCAFEIARQDGEELFRLEFSELLDDCRRRFAAPPALHVAISLHLEETHRRATTAKAEVRTSVEEVRKSLAESSALLARFRAFERRVQPKRP